MNSKIFIKTQTAACFSATVLPKIFLECTNFKEL